jgi:hypothetical protein
MFKPPVGYKMPFPVYGGKSEPYMGRSARHIQNIAGNGEKDFAVHGGTAINLFVKNMSRYSVDVDLTTFQTVMHAGDNIRKD